MIYKETIYTKEFEIFIENNIEKIVKEVSDLIFSRIDSFTDLSDKQKIAFYCSTLCTLIKVGSSAIFSSAFVLNEINNKQKNKETIKFRRQLKTTFEKNILEALDESFKESIKDLK